MTRDRAAWQSLNAEVIEEYRANDGRVARFGDTPIIILQTVGARSGELREVPLIPVISTSGPKRSVYVYGTAEGAPKHPDWVYNLRANSRISVEFEGETFVADLVEVESAAAREMVSSHAETVAVLREYLDRAAPRQIPVFRVDRVSI